MVSSNLSQLYPHCVLQSIAQTCHEEYHGWLVATYMEVYINGDTPNGWFIIEHIYCKNGWFGRTPISGTPPYRTISPPWGFYHIFYWYLPMISFVYLQPSPVEIDPQMYAMNNTPLDWLHEQCSRPLLVDDSLGDCTTQCIGDYIWQSNDIQWKDPYKPTMDRIITMPNYGLLMDTYDYNRIIMCNRSTIHGWSIIIPTYGLFL